MHDGDNDPMTPRLMDGPRRLFRAVSLPELAAIVQSGVISGGGNGFNGFDGRPLVFFGPELTEALIWQGEDAERVMSFALRFTPEFAAMQAVEQQIAAYVHSLKGRAQQAVEDYCRRFPRKADWFAEMNWDEFEQMGSRTFSRSIAELPDVVDVKATLRAKNQEVTAAIDAVRSRLRIMIDEEKVARATMNVTSAVLETSEIDGGWHYSSAWGRTGMNGEDEMGFEPGAVTSADIVSVRLICRGEVIWQGDLESALAEIHALEGPAPGLTV